MAVRISNRRTDRPVVLPGPVNDTLDPGETKTYNDIPYVILSNDEQFIYLESSKIIKMVDLDTPEDEVRTNADLNIYVSPTGSDAVGTGDEDSPYATPTRAFEDVPAVLNHNVHIRLAAGTYTDFPERLHFSAGPSGQLMLEGTGVEPVVAGPFTITSWNNLGQFGQYNEFNVAGAGWTTDQFYGKWLKVTAGTAAGFRFPIYKNTSTQITTIGAAPGTMTEFTVVDPPVTILVDHPIEFICGEQPDRTAACAYNIGAIKFQHTNATFGTYTSFLFSGGNWSIPNVGFACNGIVSMGEVGANFNFPRSNTWDNPLLGDPSFASLAFQAVSLTKQTVFQKSTIWTYGRETLLAGVVTRDRLQVQDNSRVFTDFILLPAYLAENEAQLSIFDVYMHKGGLSGVVSCATQNNCAVAHVRHVIDSIPAANYLEIGDSSFATLEDIDASGATVSGYAVLVGFFSRLLTTANARFSGTTGDIDWSSGAAPVAWPATGSSVNDTHGAFVFSKA